ncbi:MAG: hypothetical protein R3E83_15825 [Burkholderiaceae bacterium]
MRRFDLARFSLTVCLAVLCVAAPAAPLSRVDVPEPLRPWVDWVLSARPEAVCAVRYDNDEHQCAWPGPLELHASAERLDFALTVDVAAPLRLALPGGRGQWPSRVTVDERPAELVELDASPTVALSAGRHRIAGSIDWASMPDALMIPPSVGMVDLSIDGVPVPAPRWRENRLWLRERVAAQARKAMPEDRLTLTVARLISDGHPTQLLTELTVGVSGSARETVLGRPVPDGFQALKIDSPLPTRLEPDGSLRVQVRPGEWTIRVQARRIGSLDALSMVAQAQPWPADEIWVFQASPAHRLVRVQGVEQIDPRRSHAPAGWQQWPTYRMTAGQTLRLETQRRGNPDPDPDQLRLQRTFWLDFDGAGYTISDRIDGQLKRTWRLSIAPGVQLGRVALDGQPQFITEADDGRSGVEVRHGRLDLEADARLARDGAPLPASGWATVMASVAAQLQTPPGWRVVSVSGVDAAPGAWLEAWTLFDLFFVLLSTLAVARLWGIGWAALTLTGLVLIWHEPAAPRLVWLGVMAIAAMRRLVPRDGRFANLLRPLWLLAWLVLLIQALPFAVQQARLAIYPQLEHVRMPQVAQPRVTMDKLEDAREKRAQAEPRIQRSAPAAAPAPYGVPASSLAASQRSLEEADPGAIVQTGPGLPDWQWRRTGLSWNGPVAPDQTFEPWLLSPGWVSGLRLLALAVLAMLAWRMFDTGRRGAQRGGGASGGGADRGGEPPAPAAGGVGQRADAVAPSVTAALAPILLAGLLGGLLSIAGPAHAQATDGAIPSQALLDELARRLLEQPHPAPRASLPAIEIRAREQWLELDARFHALQRSAVPLPVDASDGWPMSIALDGRTRDVAVIRNAKGELWMLLPAGRHTVSVRMALQGAETVALPMPLTAQQVRFEGAGWTLTGLDGGGVPGARLVLTREQKPAETDTGPAPLMPGRLPPLFRVERVLHLGLQWRVDTTVTRLSASLEAQALAIDLLPGEAVTTDGVAVRDGRARIVVPAGSRALRWQSRLDPVAQLTLSAGDAADVIETWAIDAGPIWHVEHAGLAPIHHQDAQARWLPTWHPWPGEQLTLTVTRPKGAPGRTLTIQSSQLELTPGSQRSSAELRLNVQASQGQRHRIALPEGAELQWVKVDGRAQALRLEGGAVTVPIDPGAHRLELAWQASGALPGVWHTPRVDVGLESVNARLKVNSPADRWVFWLSGLRLGPAVLYWGC